MNKIKIMVALSLGSLFFLFQNCGQLEGIEETISDSSNGFIKSAVALRKPNIVMIMLDDAGQADWIDPGIAPNIAKFRKQATTFPAFYTAPMCAPTRISMLSGRSHVDYSMLWVCGSNAKYGIPNSDATIPQSLEKRGYVTSTIGKWHASVNDTKKAAETFPAAAEFGADQKFNYHYIPDGVVGSGYYKLNFKNGKPNVGNFNGTEKPIGKHKVDATADMVISKINEYKKSADKPFYLQYWLNAPHGPHQASVRMFKPGKERNDYIRYKNALFNKNDSRFKKEYAEANRRMLYEKLLSQADENIGRVLDLLKQDDPYLKNTIILITSDNGGTTKTRKPGNTYGNYDYLGRRLRGHKTEVFEGGIRQNLLVKMPGQTTARIDHSAITVMDLFPTYLHLAKSQPWSSEKKHFDGKTFHSRLIAPYKTFVRNAPIFTTFKVQNEHVDVTEGNDSTNFAIRKGRWKLVRDVHAGCTPCLFDFKSGYNDESDANNLAKKPGYQLLVKQLREEYLEWFLTTTQMKALPKVKGGNVSHFIEAIDGFKENGPDEYVSDYDFKSGTSKRFVELQNNIKFDVNRLDFTFTAKITPDRLIKDHWLRIAMRKGTWEFMLTPSGQLQVMVFDKYGNKSFTTSNVRLTPGKAYDVGFTLYSFKSLNTVVRIYARDHGDDLDDKERLVQVARKESFEGLRSNQNTIHIGADPSTNLPSFYGLIEDVRIYHAPLRRSEIGYGMRWWGNRYD